MKFFVMVYRQSLKYHCTRYDNLDFADVRAIMKDAGPAWMSIGKGSGQNRAVDAAKAAFTSPLLDVSYQR